MVPASVTTVPEFFAWAKTHPDGASFGSPAAGSTPHFVGALLGQQAGVDFKHVGYRGSQPALMDMMGGNIAAVSCPVGDAMQHAASGKMRLLGVSGAKRNRFMPKVPTYTEQGYKNMAHSEWFGFFLPARPSPIRWSGSTHRCARPWPAPMWSTAWPCSAWKPCRPHPPSWRR
jgi:tripartite-type tricarboxylate transporter receptor subunit TctC